MQLSPATLSTIAAILSAQGVNVNHEQLQAALAPLTGDNPPSVVLQPGEEIWLIEGKEQDCDACRVDDGFVNLEAVTEEIAERIQISRRDEHRWAGSALSEEAFDVLIVRKAVRPKLEEKFVVTV